MTLDFGKNLLWCPIDKKSRLLVTELTIDQYEIPAKVSRSHVTLQVNRTAPDKDGDYEISIDYEGYDASECTDSDSEAEAIIDMIGFCCEWFSERGAEIVE